MSYQNFGDGAAQPQAQPGQEEQGGFGAPQQQHAMGQQMDPNQQQGQFGGGPGGPGSQSGDQKTTLWYVAIAIVPR